MLQQSQFFIGSCLSMVFWVTGIVKLPKIDMALVSGESGGERGRRGKGYGDVRGKGAGEGGVRGRTGEGDKGEKGVGKGARGTIARGVGSRDRASDGRLKHMGVIRTRVRDTFQVRIGRDAWAVNGSG